jgi:hypothetical protein
MVEVPGIEPGSNGADSGLLRAQSIWRVLDLSASYDYAENTVTATKMFRRPGWPRSLVSPLTTLNGAGTLPAERVTFRY